MIQLMACMRQHKVHQPDTCIVYGGKLLKDHSRKLGDDLWSVLEQVLLAALELDAPDWAEYCLKKLVDKFPSSVRVQRLKGMYCESSGSWPEAKAIYEGILKEKPEDTLSHKRLIAILKQKGRTAEAIDQINIYLETFATDAEVWQELGEIYIEAGSLQRAAFCFEDLMLQNPRLMYHVLTYAELQYSLGDYEASRKHFCLALHLDDSSLRALWGLLTACTALQKKDEASENMQQLAEFTVERLRAVYKATGGAQSKIALQMLDSATSPYSVLNVDKPEKKEETPAK